MIRRTAIAMLALGIAVSSAEAQTYPARTIRLVAPFAPGGGTDYIARTVGKHLESANSWRVLVENKAGANGTLALTELTRADPSGYELAIGQLDNLVLAPLLTRVAFNPVTDFATIALIGRTPLVFMAAANSPYRTFSDVMAAARAAPGTVTLGSSGMGSSSHLAYELLRLKTGIELKHVPYRGSTPALTDLVGGHLNVVGSSIASAIGLIRGGEVRALAVSGAARSPTLPDVPTFAELGIADVDVSTWYGLIGPPGLPEVVTGQLNGEVGKVLARPEVVDAFKEQGLELIPQSPQAFSALLRTDVVRWAEIVGQTGIRRE